MEHEIIDRMRREEAELLRKLEAVRGLLRAYGASPEAASLARPSSDTVPVPKNHGRGREKMSIERFSDYGRSVVRAAIDECISHLGSPIASREMVALVEKRGIEVRGEDKANAISALLARSIDLKPNGRKGWTLSDEYQERQNRELEDLLGLPVPKENEPPAQTLSGSDLAHHAPIKETTE